MRPNEQTPELMLDEAIGAIRGETLTTDQIAGARARGWARLANVQSDSALPADCHEIRPLLPAYRAGRLSEEQRLKVVSHLQECTDCRRALHRTESGTLLMMPAPVKKPARNSTQRWAIAAAVLLTAGLSTWALWDRLVPVSGSRGSVQAVRGVLYRMSPSGEHVVYAGENVGEGDRLRTARGADAMIRLRDGSVVEMGERAEFFITAVRNDTTVHLDRGQIIVQAAKRRSGHLYVAAKDCRVAVTGTVFSVNTGVKGSRVSVIEGEVHVAQGGRDQVLHRGDQSTTNLQIDRLPVRQEIAWSRNVDQHLKLLAEFNELQKQWQQIRLPGLRYESKFLNALPEGTVVYASIPNYGTALQEAYRLMEDRVRESEVMRQWWQSTQAGRNQPNLRDMIDRVKTVTDYLGDEIVLVGTSQDRQLQAPVLLAEVKKSGLREYLQSEITRLGAGEQALRFADPETVGRDEGKSDAVKGLLVLVQPDMVAVSPDARALRQVLDGLQDQSQSRNRRGNRSGMQERLTAAYQNGVGLLFAANLRDIGWMVQSPTQRSEMRRERNNEALHQIGVDDLDYLIVERRDLPNRTVENQAVLATRGMRRGIFGWLAAPSSMGSLEFVSPDAVAAGSFVIQRAQSVLRDAVSMFTAVGNGGEKQMEALDQFLGVKLQDDVAAALGNDFTIAVDGPLLPTPSWKFIMEVYDPQRLQASLEKAISEVSYKAQLLGAPGAKIEKETAGARIFYKVSLLNPQTPAELYYTLTDGYWVMTPTRALLVKALQIRDSGQTLPRSNRFTALLPRDGQTHFSALLYQNMGETADTVLQGVGRTNAVSEEQKKALDRMTANLKPALVYAYGEDNQIRVASNGGFFGLNLHDLALNGLVRQAMGGAPIPGTKRLAQRTGEQ